MVDEDSAQDCYPESTSGCTAGSCRGACAYGTRACEAGVLQACRGPRTPQAEQCTQGGVMAVDESCDGRVDEGCTCRGGDTRSCYMGPDKTAGVGSCKSGVQTCQNGQFGECAGSVTPARGELQQRGRGR